MISLTHSVSRAPRLVSSLACVILLCSSACTSEEPADGGSYYGGPSPGTAGDGDGDMGEVDAGAQPSAPQVDAGGRADASAPEPQAPGPDSGAPGAPGGDAAAPDASSAEPDAGPTPEPPVSTRNPSVSVKGPYTVKSYTQGLTERTYASSIMYYPENAEGEIGAIAFSPGFTATKESYTYLGEMLASNGFAVLLTTPTSTSDQPPARGVDLEAAVARIGMENTREGSPLKGKLNGKVCITGHSMGGGGTLHGATSLGNKIACAVPLQPWQPGASFSRIVAPTLFIGAQRDNIAGVSSNALPHYRSIPDSVEKIYAEVGGADHYYSTNRNRDHAVEAHVMVAWYHVHLHGDARYRPYLYGDKKLASGFSMYMSSRQQ